jgi:hypothetical protein
MSVSESAGKYVDWGVVHISVTNLVVIGVMIVVFVAAILLPFPKPQEAPAEVRPDEEPRP